MPARVCPRCGHSELSLKRIDQYFSLFFIPLFRVKKGPLIISCDHCFSLFDERGMPLEQQTVVKIQTEDRKCPNCGRSLEGDFEFCPRCGRKVSRS
jgi:ribosomal protein S27AE